jgi:hypothetical protein
MVKSKKATGGFHILCDEVTQRLCTGQARFDEVHGITLKGKSEGTKIYGVETLLKKGGEAAGAGPGEQRREVTSFVGREAIVDQLMTKISDVVEQQTLSGEARELETQNASSFFAFCCVSASVCA